MKDRWLLAGAAVVAVLMFAATAVFVTSQGPAGASALSRGGLGWLAARRYLEARGAEVTLLDRGLDAAPAKGVLVLAFPWPSYAGRTDVRRAIDRYLQSGGTLLFAYSGDALDVNEPRVAEQLGLESEERRGRPPLHPRRWKAYVSEEWSFVPVGRAPRAGRMTAVRNVPRPPRGAEILARDGEGRSLAFAYSRLRGRVVVVPAEAFSNARLGQAGNADLLERLRLEHGPRWIFDEFHHGLRAPVTAEESAPPRILLLYLLQVAFVYALVAWAVVRRFGPAWTEAVPAASSSAQFLLGLGALHHRLGHHREAAPLLVSRARALDGRLPPMGSVVTNANDFLELARRLGEVQGGRATGA